MKQHITPQQLSQLSKKGRSNLKNWWWNKKQIGDLFHVLGGDPISVMFDNEYLDGLLSQPKHKKNIDPLLSIGQMIELLNKYNINLQISDTENSLISLTDNGRWLVHDATIIKSLNRIYTDAGTGELCDALWSACVELLNGE